jgi:hypothetical protein
MPTNPKDQLKAQLNALLRGKDVQLVAYVLHELTSDYFIHYASDVATAQYQAGCAEGEDRCAREPSRARFVEAGGHRRTLTEWAEVLNLPRRTLHDRVEREGAAYIERVLAESVRADRKAAS